MPKKILSEYLKQSYIRLKHVHCSVVLLLQQRITENKLLIKIVISTNFVKDYTLH